MISNEFKDELDHYIETGELRSEFLDAIITNDLYESIFIMESLKPDISLFDIWDCVNYMKQNAPPECHGGVAEVGNYIYRKKQNVKS